VREGFSQLILLFAMTGRTNQKIMCGFTQDFAEQVEPASPVIHQTYPVETLRTGFPS
jgi:hypothetical protein